MDERRLAGLAAMGIPVWVRRASVDAGGEEHSEPVSTMDWEALEGAVAGCVRCGLHAGRTRTVFGVGSRTADLMIIGEAPGAEEDRRGEPFVGRAGKLLDAMLAALGLDRRTVFIANILKCRPPQNRDPRPDEAATCAPYLARQIELISPRLILAVGRVAAQNLLQTEAPLGRLRGRLHPLEPAGVPVLVTYHPAFLLRRLEAKADAWRDLLSAAAFLRSGDAR